MTCNKFKGLLCKIGMHDMQKVAHWCDRECSIIIVEYKCARCGHEAWDFLYFDPDSCVALNRIDLEMMPTEAADFAECGKASCEIAKQSKPKAPKKKASNKAGNGSTAGGASKAKGCEVQAK